MWRVATVYGLASSADNKIRYVGQTVRSLGSRLKDHIRIARNKKHRHLSHWINKTLSNGFNVTIFVIENHVVSGDAEIRWIAWYRRHGVKLVNGTNGGDGGRLGPKTPEECKKISNALKGKKKSKEHVAAMRLVIKKPVTKEARLKMSLAKKGKMPKNLKEIQKNNRGLIRSPEVRKRISEKLKGRQVTSTKKLLINLEKARVARQ